MFWKSIFEGFGILIHWQVWVAMLAYMVLHFAFLLLIATIVGKDDSGGRMAVGCLFQMFGGVLFHGILMGLLVTFLLPILLGGDQATSLPEMIYLAWPAAKVGIIAVIIVTILCFVPIIGGFIAESAGIQAFLEGVIIFRIISVYAIEEVIQLINVPGKIFPGFLESIGFLIIAGVLVYAIIFGLALLSERIEETVAAEWIVVFVAPVLGVLGGILPLFMYSSYIRLSLIQLIPY